MIVVVQHGCVTHHASSLACYLRCDGVSSFGVTEIVVKLQNLCFGFKLVCLAELTEIGQNSFFLN